MTEMVETADMAADAAGAADAAAEEAAAMAEAAEAAEADTVPAHGKCTMRPAQAVRRHARCRSSHKKAGPYTAGTATLRTGPQGATITK